ncbi:MAG: circularly permuted type 2 ATP-grasp protein, partial [Magnetococcales bacterium]|nr:circularly permuted type 2 ATP-grasp protein [Magnetococcales bacterium]
MTPSSAPPSIPSLLQGYGAIGRDEMFEANGEVRPCWRPLLEFVQRTGAARLHEIRDSASRILRESGVTYTVYGDPQGFSRPWELDPLPLLLEEAEWKEVERGLIQRRELLDRLLRDLHGPQEVVGLGLLPPELLHASLGFLFPCHGQEFRPQCALPLYAADLGRSQDGRFVVLTDRVQSPSGLGYLLENRITLSRILSEPLRGVTYLRLRRFYETFRRNLASLAPTPREDPHLVLLTPGPANETYFEHSFLANYLGLALVQGADLTVRSGRVHLKTLDGLHPVDVIWRRVDDSFCDPLELRGDSLLGTAGLTAAARRGGVTMVNPLGAGVLDNHLLHAFMPQLARYFLGEELLLPSLPTWWCGLPDHLEQAMEQLEQLVIKPVFSNPGEPPVHGGGLSGAELEATRRRILARPAHYVAQRRCDPSTVPVL